MLVEIQNRFLTCRESHEPGYRHLSAQFLREFVVSANLCNTPWSCFTMDRMAVSAKIHTKLPQTPRGTIKLVAREIPSLHGPETQGSVIAPRSAV